MAKPIAGKALEMLTDTALRKLKPKEKSYKVADRDGMYAMVAPSGLITFRYDYRLNGRRETLTIGRYGPDGLSLSRARELCLGARKMVAEGHSPAQEKQREKRRRSAAQTFGAFGKRWFKEAPEECRDRRSPCASSGCCPPSVWKSRLLTEVSPDDLRALCAKVKDRGAPATAIHVRDIVKQIYGYAVLHGERVANPAGEVGPSSIATFAPKDRGELEHAATLPTIRLGIRLILLTMVRKGELLDATWDEVDFEDAVWTIPKERMKRGKPHNVYLSASRSTF